MANYTRTDPFIRFWAKVNKDGPVSNLGQCWLWTAATIRGHASFYASPEEGKVYAHRWLYERTVGPVPDGLELDHLCRRKNCVNPAHLEPVTDQTNFLRGDAIGAQCVRTNRCMAGHEFTPENTYIRKDTGARMCRTCTRIRDRAGYRRRKGLVKDGTAL